MTLEQERGRLYRPASEDGRRSRVSEPGVMAEWQAGLKERVDSGIAILEADPTTAEYAKLIRAEVDRWAPGLWTKVHMAFAEPIKDSDVSPKSNVIDQRVRRKSYDTEVLLPTDGKFGGVRSAVQRTVKVLGNYDRPVILKVVLDGTPADDSLPSFLAETLAQADFDYKVLQMQHPAGYRRALMHGLTDETDKSETSVVGFVDDDAFPLYDGHFNLLRERLDDDQDIAAISGLALDRNNGDVLHDFFNIPSDLQLHMQALDDGVYLDKPHIHGGGGISLMRREMFHEGLDYSLRHGMLFGPVVSAHSLIAGKKAVAAADLPVVHPTKTAFADWLRMTRRYYNSWKPLEGKVGAVNRDYRHIYLPQLESVIGKYEGEEKLAQYNQLKKFRRQFKQ